MKKFFATIAVIMLLSAPSLCLSAQADANSGASVEYSNDGNKKKVKTGEVLTLNKVVKKYKDSRKAEYIKFDGFLLSLAKMGMKADGELPPQAVDALKSMVILSMDDCSPELRQNFKADMESALAGCELILEAKDEEDTVSIYVGKMEGEYFEDFIIYEADDCDLVIMQGKFPMSALQQMVNEHKD